MRQILIFGNSGSGKSTLARKLSQSDNLSHLDLDSLAWQPTNPPVRKPLEESKAKILEFIETSRGWVIEGCYTDLLEIAEPYSSEAIFMDLPIASCVENAKRRPWEPHKYKSKAAQDDNLDMLIDWIQAYATREDTFSESAHRRLFDNYGGQKRQIFRNE